ncbi:40S ribosomal protein S3a-A [Dirofilaria immitis]
MKDRKAPFIRLFFVSFTNAKNGQSEKGHYARSITVHINKNGYSSLVSQMRKMVNQKKDIMRDLLRDGKGKNDVRAVDSNNGGGGGDGVSGDGGGGGAVVVVRL